MASHHCINYTKKTESCQVGNPKLKTFPDLSARCIALKLDLPLRLWYLFRGEFGKGWLTVEEAHRLSCGNSRQTKSWIAKGMGIFWTRTGDKLFLKGIGKVATELGVPLYQAPVNIPHEKIQNLKTFRAYLFASWFADKPKTISQRKLGEIFGRTPRTLYGWAKLAGIEVTKNLAYAGLPNDDNIDKYPKGTRKALHWAEEGDRPNNVWQETWDENTVLVWRIPNTYQSDLETGKKTTIQRLATRRAKRGCNTFDYTAKANGKLFWDKDARAKSYMRGLRQTGLAFLEEGRGHHGYNLWGFVAL